ncbi:hypothetical protein OUZ56_016444 [Daphnia magna]|uniref:Uncharacterized protein n=1 Tax=Daphnia magna TaxID=35525 RepID=A0ABR0AQJ7_9CRUS|nr:hypothetical protein OUZ56_016444 [Daphnia magna]
MAAGSTLVVWFSLERKVAEELNENLSVGRRPQGGSTFHLPISSSVSQLRIQQLELHGEPHSVSQPRVKWLCDKEPAAMEAFPIGVG